MVNWEKDLPPIARDRLARIGEFTHDEKERMIDSSKLSSLLSEFYQGQIDPESLWKKLKAEGRPSLLREAQLMLLDSLTFGSTADELQGRRDGILAIETLKEAQNTSAVEMNLNLIHDLQKRHAEEMEQADSSIRTEVERNPQLRIRQVQQGQRNVHMQLTVDEAIKQLPQWQDFRSEHEGRCTMEFSRLIERLKRELR